MTGERPTTHGTLRVLLALAGAALAGFLWLVLGSSPAGAEGIGDPLTPVVEPVVEPVTDTADHAVEAVEAAAPALDGAPPVDPVTAVETVTTDVGRVANEVVAVTPLEPVVEQVVAPILDPVVDGIDEPLPVVLPPPSDLPGSLAPEPASPAPGAGPPGLDRGDGAVTPGPAIPELGLSARIEPVDVASPAPTWSAAERGGSAGGGSRSLPLAATPAVGSSNSSNGGGGTSRGDPLQLAVLFTVAALALGSGRRVPWASALSPPMGLASLIERPG